MSLSFSAACSWVSWKACEFLICRVWRVKPPFSEVVENKLQGVMETRSRVLVLFTLPFNFLFSSPCSESLVFCLVIYKIKCKLQSACLRSFTFCLPPTDLSFEPLFYQLFSKESTSGTYLSLNQSSTTGLNLCTRSLPIPSSHPSAPLPSSILHASHPQCSSGH